MKILLVEDDFIWSTQINLMLVVLGYENIVVCNTLEELTSEITIEIPDLIISDVQFEGVIIFNFLLVNQLNKVPIIFATALGDDLFYDSSLLFNHSTFIIKPFHLLTLKSNIKTVLLDNTIVASSSKEYILIYGKYKEEIKIEISKIIYIHAKKNYCFVKTLHNSYMVRRSLSSFYNEFQTHFVQFNKSYIINEKYISKVDLSVKKIIKLKFLEIALPIGRHYNNKAKEYYTNKINY
jgi:two-component system response regulator LytT